MPYYNIVYILRNISDMLFVVIHPSKHFFLCFFYILILIVPIINLATLDRLIHLLKFKFSQILKWSII